MKIINNDYFVHFLACLLVVSGLKHQINEFLSKTTIKQCFYVIKNLWNLPDIFNLNTNQLVINIICGGKSGSGHKKAVNNG